MEASAVPAPNPQIPPRKFEPDVEKIKRNLVQKGVFPTPKIVRTLRKKEIQKHNRKIAKSKPDTPSITPSQLRELSEESNFRTIKREYRRFSREIDGKTKRGSVSLLAAGKPWERIEQAKLPEFAGRNEVVDGDRLKRENLVELKEMFEKDLRWVLDDDVELGDIDLEKQEDKQPRDSATWWRSEKEAIRVLVLRLSQREITQRHWKFVRMMKQSGLKFTEGQLLKVVGELGKRGKWKQSMAVVDWVYGDKERRSLKNRFVYTKLLSVLGKARRPQEAMRIFNMMLGDYLTYPDMSAYHSIAVTLGQAGFLKELIHTIECMRQIPAKPIKNMCSNNWDPMLEPDLVIYNAVLNACVPLQQWKGVSWVFEQLRNSGLEPDGATYGLAMEVMLQSGKYDLVHELFRRMEERGETPKSLTYRVLVKAFWEEGKIDEAVAAVRDMELRGVVGIASVYYELARCLCSVGRWQDAMKEVNKIKKLSFRKPLEITFTGLIMASMDGGHYDDCISIFQYMKDHCSPNIGTINVMLKAYGQNDMFSKAKELFEEIKRPESGPSVVFDESVASITPDRYTYTSMLEASARAHQWEYFEYIYKERILSGHQLDQTKHGMLLVEASRAGKCHLLEHAFDSLLESGEIPNSELFTEMLIQAIAQSNYERALTLVNTMAYAPFQVSENQWTELFMKNGDRIRLDGLEELLNYLYDSELSSETTAANLLRSLQSILGTATTSEVSSFSSLDSEGSIQGNGRVKMLASTDVADQINNVPSDPSEATHAAFDLFESSHFRDVEENSADIKVESPPQSSDVEADTASLDHFIKEIFTNDVGEYSSDFDGEETDWPIYGVASKSPSAHKILEAWKESRNDSETFFQVLRQ